MNNPDVTIIDYGVGNLLSVQKAFEHCGANVEITSDPEKIYIARRIVLPGVGAYSDAMHSLSKLGLTKVIKKIAENGKPLLGICLGMQLLFDESMEFGRCSGLGVLPGKVIAIPTKNSPSNVIKIPHIGWTQLHLTDPGSGLEESLLEGLDAKDEVYFSHSFVAAPLNQNHCLALFKYGEDFFPALVGFGRIVGCQFHPEKSGVIGLRIIKKFLSY